MRARLSTYSRNLYAPYKNKSTIGLHNMQLEIGFIVGGLQTGSKALLEVSSGQRRLNILFLAGAAGPNFLGENKATPN